MLELRMPAPISRQTPNELLDPAFDRPWFEMVLQSQPGASTRRNLGPLYNHGAERREVPVMRSARCSAQQHTHREFPRPKRSLVA